MRSIRLWKLFITPFIVIAISLLYEKGNLYLTKRRDFASIAQHTRAIVEIDPYSMKRARVAKVIDGDTIQLVSGEKVRYIGIDTPETKHPKKGVQCFGHEASIANQGLVEDKEILLQKDISETDRYGRILRYIYLPNPVATHEALFVNEYLVEQGFAHLLTYPPDIKYNEVLREAQTYAREQNNGLWSKCK